MKRSFKWMMVLGCGLAAAQFLHAQAAPQQNPTNSQQSPPADQKRPPAQQPAPSQANPFPDDTSNVPVVPLTATPAVPPPSDSDLKRNAERLTGEDSDPVRSPDDATPESAGSDGFSSSLQGTDDIKIPADDKRGKHSDEEPVHTDSAKEDINVGGYYLERKNWRAALSRFQSAMVLSPEDPEVYWGLAEAHRELGHYADAKENYLKVVDYDPDSKHGKEAKKALKDPLIANAKKPAQPVSGQSALPQQ